MGNCNSYCGMCKTESSEEEDEKDNIEQTNKNLQNIMKNLPEDERVVFSLKIQKDRIISRMTDLEKRTSDLQSKTISSLKNGNKDQAKLYLAQKKFINEHIKDYNIKLIFIEKQIFSIEQAKDNEQFTKLVADSNKALKKLNEKVDIESIQTAKILEEQMWSKNKEMNRLLADDEVNYELESMIKQYTNDQYSFVKNHRTETSSSYGLENVKHTNYEAINVNKPNRRLKY